jgi:hypothetical protein
MNDDASFTRRKYTGPEGGEPPSNGARGSDPLPPGKKPRFPFVA